MTQTETTVDGNNLNVITGTTGGMTATTTAPLGAGKEFIPPRKVAIVGTAPGWEECPTGPEWQRWAANWAQVCYETEQDPWPGTEPDHLTFDRIYELHDALTRDNAASAALTRESISKSCSPRADVWAFYGAPLWTSRILPAEALARRFGRYFTNSIAWMIGHALSEHLDGNLIGELGVYGVNMATSKEFGHERPSVEYFLGYARGLGIEVTIPEASDLLHCANLYGHAQDTWYEHKLLAERLRVARVLAYLDPVKYPERVAAAEDTLYELEYLLRLRFHTPAGSER